MATPQYWLARWLDDNGITNEWEIRNFLGSEVGRKELSQAIEAAMAARQEQMIEDAIRTGENGRSRDNNWVQNSDAIAAGRRLDLSGTVSCNAYECLRSGIDTTFKRVWHYFDQIVVEGLSPLILWEQLARCAREHQYLIFEKVTGHARLLFYLREIGADKCLIFEPKSNVFCQEHWIQHAEELGLAGTFDKSQVERAIKKIVEASSFAIRDVDPVSWHVTVSGRYFVEPFSVLYTSAEFLGRPEPREIASQIISSYGVSMISDVGLARRLRVPLVEPMETPWMSSRGGHKADSDTTDAAISVGLPVFDNLTTADFLKLREDEKPDFDAFRSALRSAITSELAGCGDKSPQEVARNVERDYVRPGLAEIQRRVRTSRRAMLKGAAVDLSITLATTAIGALSTLPLVVGGIAVLGGGVALAPAMNKYVDERRSVEMSDLYFLWRMRKESPHI